MEKYTHIYHVRNCLVQLSNLYEVKANQYIILIYNFYIDNFIFILLQICFIIIILYLYKNENIY